MSIAGNVVAPQLLQVWDPHEYSQYNHMLVLLAGFCGTEVVRWSGGPMNTMVFWYMLLCLRSAVLCQQTLQIRGLRHKARQVHLVTEHPKPMWSH